jgi:hypothetical protein
MGAIMPQVDPKRDWLFVGCERGHDWVQIGGCNCGCYDEASCSVPVHECRRCGDCDYGENPETDKIRHACDDENGHCKTFAVR